MSNPALSPSALDPDGFVERGRINGAANGPLAGVRLAVKDNIQVEGMAHTAGHPIFHDRTAGGHATIVQQLLALGATVVGVTRTDAGGFGVTTPGLANPVAPDRVIGGSSGGNAAALVGDHADLAIGTDTGGSVRIPAACTGLVGFKPSHGLLSTDGVWPLAPSLDHVGLMAGSVGTISTAFSWLTEAVREADETARPIRIGLGGGATWVRTPAVASRLAEAVERAEAAGHTVLPVELPDRDTVVATHGVLVLSECRAVYDGLSEEEIARLGRAAARALALPALDEDLILRARDIVVRVRAAMDRIFRLVDVVLTPALPVEPPKTTARRVTLGDREVPVLEALVAETCLANLVGSPAIVFPMEPTDRLDPVPFSVQLLGAYGADRRLLAAAARLSDAMMCDD